VTRRRLDLDERRAALAAFETIFRSRDPFGEPFRPMRDSRRAILFPIDIEMDGGELAAAFATARAAGDQGFYVSTVDSDDWATRRRHWFVPLDRPDVYYELGLSRTWRERDCAVYAPSGTWGMLRSEDYHAVVGGRRDLIDTLLRRYPAEFPIYDVDGPRPPKVPAENQVNSFVSWWLEGRRIEELDWLRRLLEHVYGQEGADLFAALARSEPGRG
jgi:hypothetical protein